MTIKTKLLPFPFLLFFSFILLCSSCRRSENNAGKVITLTIATLNGPSAISMIAMMQDSMLNDSVKLNFVIKNEPNQVKPLVMQGEADLAILPTNMAAILYNKGVDYRVAAIPVWGTLYLFGSDTTIKSWTDLKGKRLYLMALGMTPDIVVRYLLQKNGLDPERDLKLDYSFPSHLDLGNAVAAGRVSLAVISEPMVSIAMARNPSIKRLISVETEWNRILADSIPFAQTALMVKGKFAMEHPSIVASFMEEYSKSIEWLNRNPGKAALLIYEKGIIPDSSIARKTIPGCSIRYQAAAGIKSGIISYLRVLYEFDPAMIGGKLPDDMFFFTIPK